MYITLMYQKFSILTYFCMKIFIFCHGLLTAGLAKTTAHRVLFLVSMDSQRSKYFDGSHFWALGCLLTASGVLKSIWAIMPPPPDENKRPPLYSRALLGVLLLLHLWFLLKGLRLCYITLISRFCCRLMTPSDASLYRVKVLFFSSVIWYLCMLSPCWVLLDRFGMLRLRLWSLSILF